MERKYFYVQNELDMRDDFHALSGESRLFSEYLV